MQFLPISLLLVAGIAAAVKPDCGGGFIFYEGNCYKLYTSPKTFFDAFEYCQQNSASLASIENYGEANFIRTTFRRHGGYRTWIGGIEEAEGQWGWVDQQPWIWTRWWSGEPNNAGDSCAALKSCWINWADENCDRKYQFICKRTYTPNYRL